MEAHHTQKARTGFDRLWRAGRISLSGLRAAYREKAFRQEAWLACVLVPLSFFVGRGWLEVVLLDALVALVLITEIVNTAVEAAIDRIGPEFHELSGRAKDLGSAAVFVALVLCAGGWIAALVSRLG